MVGHGFQPCSFPMCSRLFFAFIEQIIGDFSLPSLDPLVEFQMRILGPNCEPASYIKALTSTRGVEKTMPQRRHSVHRIRRSFYQTV